MATDLNSVTLVGRLTRDPELRTTSGGTNLCNISLACNNSYGSGENKKEEVYFFEATAWGRLADILHQYGRKGHRVGIVGRLQQQRWQDQEGKNHAKVSIVIEHIQLLESKKDDDQQTRQSQPASQSPIYHQPAQSTDYQPEDEFPF